MKHPKPRIATVHQSELPPDRSVRDSGLKHATQQHNLRQRQPVRGNERRRLLAGMRTWHRPWWCGALLLLVLLGPSWALTPENGTTVDGLNGEPEPESTPHRILSRKRRFLTFPEGSSFQVVYDQTIPMIGVERLFTIGITVALAYELPSITINQIEEMLRENAADGYIFPKMDENANATVLVDSGVTPARKNIFDYYYQTPRPGQPMRGGGVGGGRINYYTAPGAQAGLDGANRRYDPTDRYGQRPSQWDRFAASGLLRPPYVNPSRNDFGSIVNRYVQGWVRRHPPNYPVGKKRFYPVFGKRSIRVDTGPLDRHFLNHHRVTRHALYERIEKFLTAKGKHGHHCVLRALCESGQRRNDTEPDTFLKEILRAIFSLPPTHETPNHHKHRLYDAAHAHTGNCAEAYSYCEDSFWSSDFVF